MILTFNSFRASNEIYAFVHILQMARWRHVGGYVPMLGSAPPLVVTARLGGRPSATGGPKYPERVSGLPPTPSSPNIESRPLFCESIHHAGVNDLSNRSHLILLFYNIKKLISPCQSCSKRVIVQYYFSDLNKFFKVSNT